MAGNTNTHIRTTDIDEAQAAKIIGVTEDHFADVKAIDVAPAKLIKHLVAFANADGGELFIGIDNEPRAWRGFEAQEQANGHIQAFDSIFIFPSDDAEYEFLRCPELPGLVLKITIRKAQGLKRSGDGTVYARRNAQSLPVKSTESVRRLEFAKGITSFEATSSGAPLDRLLQSQTLANFMKEVVPHQDPEVFLRKQGLVDSRAVTVAGVLLFDDLPQAVLPSRSMLKLYRYKTTASEGDRESLAFDPISVEGPVYDQIREAVQHTVQQVELIKKMGDHGLETVTYPPDALHEIVANAVLHRDYSIADTIHIRIFDNRIEVESPGRLPAHITPENILEERFVRNGNLFRLVNKFPDPPNKGVGEGLNTAFRAMQALKLKNPLIVQRENAVVVVLRHEPLASPEETIVEYLKVNPTIKNKQAREVCHITEDWKVKAIFERMQRNGIIEKVPGTDRSTSAYRLPSSTPVRTADPQAEGTLFEQ